MKAMIQKKTAAMLALMLSISLLLPIIAYAGAYFGKITNSEGTVNGQVYMLESVYGDLDNKQKLNIHVYGNNGELAGIVYGTYASYDSVSGMVYYNFDVPSATYANYSALTFKYFYPESYIGADPVVSTYVYRTTSGPIGGGGGGANSGEIVTGANGVVNADLLKMALSDGSATIAISGNQAHLPASALTVDGKVTIVAAGASYTLPTSELNLAELAKELGVEIDGLTITVTIDAVTGEAKTNVEAAATKAGGKVVGGIFEFKVEAVAGDKKVEVKNFDTYVERTIKVTSSNATGVLYDPATGEFSFIPATFSNGVATLKSTHNSIYTVIETEAKSFADLADHWSKKDVEKLASNLIVNGTGADKFEPTRAITRAEFAAMITRALGLSTSATTDKFSDVDSSAWYAGAVAAAANAGIVNGDTAGTFRPSAVITRQELAAMVVRAMKFAGKEVTLTDAQVSEALAAYTDADKLGWAKAEVAAAVSAGIVKGQNATSVAPLATSNRAEAATMVIRLLTNVGFLN
jgi:N-acetylmuramoyl-L-alanine amidase